MYTCFGPLWLVHLNCAKTWCLTLWYNIDLMFRSVGWLNVFGQNVIIINMWSIWAHTSPTHSLTDRDVWLSK